MARKKKTENETLVDKIAASDKDTLNLKEKATKPTADDSIKMDNSILNEIIKNHKAFKDIEKRINQNADKGTDNSFLLIQGRINALMELIARNELSYINEIKEPKKILENKLFNEWRLALIKLNIDLLAKTAKSEEDVNETVDIQRLKEAFTFGDD